MQREVELVNQRTNWLLASQTLLLASYIGTIIACTSDAVAQGEFAVLSALLVLIACIGLVTCRLLGLSIAAGLDAWNMWRRRYLELAQEALELGGVYLEWLPWCDRARSKWVYESSVPFFNVFRWGRAPFLSRRSDRIEPEVRLAQPLLAPLMFWLWTGLTVVAWWLRS